MKVNEVSFLVIKNDPDYPASRILKFAHIITFPDVSYTIVYLKHDGLNSYS